MCNSTYIMCVTTFLTALIFMLFVFGKKPTKVKIASSAYREHYYNPFGQIQQHQKLTYVPLTNEERISYYLGDIQHTEIDNMYKSKNKLMTYDTIQDKYWVWGHDLKTFLTKHNLHLNKELVFDFESGDIDKPTNRYALVRNRSVNYKTEIIDRKPTLMKSMTLGRHWASVYNPQHVDIVPFSQKKNIIFWRGATTGEEDKPGNRFDIVKKYFKKYDFIDVGYSGTCQGKEKKYSQYVLGSCDIPKFLEHKFILSLEGNDKDSGINWKLNSDCVVVMPKPRHTSWLMEDKLVPGYHYVLLKDDFSDLVEKYEWMMNHLDECKAIIKNANDYMKQFLDVANEEYIELEVVKRYLRKMNPHVAI